MKRAVAPASDFAFYGREPIDGRPEYVKHVGVDVAQERDSIGGHSFGNARVAGNGVWGSQGMNSSPGSTRCHWQGPPAGDEATNIAHQVSSWSRLPWIQKVLVSFCRHAER